MPAETAEVQLPEVKAKPFENKPVPQEVLDRSFSLDNFEVEQLPAHKSKVEEESSDDLKTKAEQAAKKSTEEQLGKTLSKPADKIEEAADKEEKVEAKVEDKPKPKSVLKPPTKKEEQKTTEKVDTKTEVKPIVPPEKKNIARDYSGFTEEQASVLKQMSNDAFQYTAKLIKEANELKQSSYLQHPEAYRLSPEYNQTVQSYSRADWETKYWESQLETIEAGKPIKPFRGWDNETGQPVFGDEIQPTKSLENRIQQAILQCTTEARRLQGDIRNFPSRYKTDTTQHLAGIDQWRNQNFGWNASPEMMDYTLEIDGLGERSLKQIKEDVDKMIPSFLHASPLRPVVQDLAIAVRILQAEKAQLQSELGIKTTIKEEKELVEPSGKGKHTEKPNLTKVHGISEFNVDPELGI
jgi:hypothetical protein